MQTYNPTQSPTTKNSQNSVRSFYQNAEDGTAKAIKEKVLSVLHNSNVPLCQRSIARKARIELCSLQRALLDLQDNLPQLVKISHHDKSPFTGRKVAFYSLIGETVEEGTQLLLEMEKPVDKTGP